MWQRLDGSPQLDSGPPEPSVSTTDDTEYEIHRTYLFQTSSPEPGPSDSARDTMRATRRQDSPIVYLPCAMYEPKEQLFREWCGACACGPELALNREQW